MRAILFLSIFGCTAIGCRPAPCACAFDSNLEAAISACPPDPSFPADLGTPTADLSPFPMQVDDGGTLSPTVDLGALDLSLPVDLGPPSSCLSIYRVVTAKAALRQGRSPVSLVLDTLKLDETVTAIAERSAFSNAIVYRIVQRADSAACGYLEANDLVPAGKARTVKRSVDPAADSAACITGRN